MKEEEKVLLRALKEKTILYLVINEGCNLNCLYCSWRRMKEHYNIPFSSMMTLDTATKAIDIYLNLFNPEKNRKRKSLITFYGGEPLLNKKVVFESIKYIDRIKKKTGLDIEMVINTNGTLITKNFAENLIDKNVTIVVSIDGPKEIHNKYRKNINREGSFDKIIKGLEILKETNIKTCLSIVLTPLNFDYGRAVSEIARQFNIKEIGVNTLVGDTIFSIEKELDIYKYAEKAAKATKEYSEKAKKLGIKEDQMNRKEKSFSTSFPFIDCFAYGSQIVVWPNRKIGICPYLRNVILGDIDLPIEKLRKNKKTITQQLIQRLPLFNKECRNCKFREICGGGCAFSALLLKGNFMKRDLLNCEYIKELYCLFSKDLKN